MIYDFENIPVLTFYKISETGDLKFLDSKMKIHENSNDIWLSIVDKFNDVSGNLTHKNYIQDRFLLIKLKNRHTILSNSILILSEIYDKEIVKILKSMGYSFDKENIANSLDLLSKQLGTLVKKIELKNKEFSKKYNSDQKKEEYLVYKLAKSISKMTGFQIDINNMLLVTFALYLKDLKEWQVEK